MGSEGQNNPKNISDAERKRPWEVFSEEEINTIKLNQKRINSHKKKKLKKEKNKSRITNSILLIENHKFLVIGVTLGIILVIGCIFIVSHLVGLQDQQNRKSYDSQEKEKTNFEDPYDKITIKTAASPEDAYGATVYKLKPILLDGIFDTGTTNFSKIEDNYEAVARTLESDYERTCYYLFMLETMFNFNEKTGGERAKFLLRQFNDKKLKLDETQYFFYLSVLISQAVYDKDESLQEKYQDERDKKYPIGSSYMDFDTGRLITDKEELKRIKEEILKSASEYEEDN